MHIVSSGYTVKLIWKYFMRYGIPEEVVIDGGPEFDNQMNWPINTDSNGNPAHQRWQTPMEWQNHL